MFEDSPPNLDQAMLLRARLRRQRSWRERWRYDLVPNVFVKTFSRFMVSCFVLSLAAPFLASSSRVVYWGWECLLPAAHGAAFGSAPVAACFFITGWACYCQRHFHNAAIFGLLAAVAASVTLVDEHVFLLIGFQIRVTAILALVVAACHAMWCGRQIASASEAEGKWARPER